MILYRKFTIFFILFVVAFASCDRYKLGVKQANQAMQGSHPQVAMALVSAIADFQQAADLSNKQKRIIQDYGYESPQGVRVYQPKKPQIQFAHLLFTKQSGYNELDSLAYFVGVYNLKKNQQPKTYNFNSQANSEFNPGSKIKISQNKKEYNAADLFAISFRVQVDGTVRIKRLRLIAFTPVTFEEAILDGHDHFAVRAYTNTTFPIMPGRKASYKDNQTLTLYKKLAEGQRAYRITLIRLRSEFKQISLDPKALNIKYQVQPATKVLKFNKRLAYDALSDRPEGFIDRFHYARLDRIDVDSVMPETKSVKPAKPAIIYKQGKKPIYETSSDSVATVLPVPRPGEGVWTSRKLGPVGLNVDETFLHPDPIRPHAKVRFIRFKKGSFELKMVAGTQEPKPSKKGYIAKGKIPWQTGLDKNLAVYVSGGFKSNHSPGGMKTDGIIIRKPGKQFATLGVYQSGAVTINLWNRIKNKGGLSQFRQNCPLFVDNGQVVVDTQLRFYGIGWGLLVFTWRSGFGYDQAGNLIYAIGNSVSPYTFGQALILAGAKNAMMLEINEPFIQAAEYKGKMAGMNQKPANIFAPPKGEMSKTFTVAPAAKKLRYVGDYGFQPIWTEVPGSNMLISEISTRDFFLISKRDAE